MPGKGKSGKRSNRKKNISNSSSSNDLGSGFECNICLSGAQRPVVTLCGHLYCWPCLYKWLEHSSKNECPVCKAPVSAKTVIPIYGRGRPQTDPRKIPPSVPKRPQAHRPRAATVPLLYLNGGTVNSSNPGEDDGSGAAVGDSGDGRARNGDGGGGSGSIGSSLSVTFGLLPSLFGANRGPTLAAAANQALGQEFMREAQQEQLSRMLLFLGSLVIVCLLMF
eukprot:CAMPEP_0185254116 /NCGR_PEP_ID=MMETSP1359-20130426/2772_1 /TAXON_ID=552665 /ORGANISM="Bigelowiella longifila, Strain CCMP242" /LENGTH=221 /DNA_ID=CAMNT_0027836769 /DNA_START=90 /DNA_END=755 /DNA_ORIENTATION=-